MEYSPLRFYIVQIVLFLTVISWSDTQSERKDDSVFDLPRIRSQNGALYIEAGGSGNGSISLRAASVTVGSQDLVAFVDAARANLSALSGQMETVVSHLGLGAGDNSTDSPLRNVPSTTQTDSRKVRNLQRKVRQLEQKHQELITLLNKDECLSSPCKNGGTCIDKYNGFTCLCDPGWEGPLCDDDVDECVLFDGTELGCQNGATCVNTDGSFNCTCPPAYHGLHCTTKKDDCTGSSNYELCGAGTCIPATRTSHDTPSYSCVCNPGWTKGNDTNAPCTIDINECTSSHPPCSTVPPVACINTPGSFRCGPCPPGYSGNGIVCTDVNECLVDNGGCSKDPLVSCINTVGSFYCGVCPYGYQGNGFTCTPYGSSCAVNNGGCHPRATCTTSLWGYPVCSCPTGYSGNGVGWTGCKLVVAANPCDSSPCQNGGYCINSAGTFKCLCIAPYSGATCAGYMQSCGGSLTGTTGRFSSPTDPQDSTQYGHNLNCTWDITVDPGEVVWLKFLSFQLEQHANCKYDYVEVIDPSATGNTNGTLARLCGKDTPQSFQSSSNKMSVKIVTDNSVSYGGFVAMFSALDSTKVCGGELRQASGTIKSPNYPDEYPAFSSCTWIITTDEGHQIVLNITDFDLEQHDDCQADYLEVRNGGTESSPLFGRLCGKRTPAVISSHTNKMFVRFVSDRFRTAKGFRADYFTTATGCNGKMRVPYGAISSPNYPSPYNHNSECFWQIHAAAGSNIKVSIIDFDLENSVGCKYDFLQFFDGPSSIGKQVVSYCGAVIPPLPVISTYNELFIKFRTDLSAHGRGFYLTYQAVISGPVSSAGILLQLGTCKKHLRNCARHPVLNEKPDRLGFTVCSNRTLKQRSGAIESPAFPDPYPPNSNCDYKIEVPRGNRINVTFSRFSVTGSANCTTGDFLAVYDGDSEQKTNLLGRYCGSVPPKPFQSSTHLLYVKFISDSVVGGAGFRMEWVTHGCGGDINVDKRNSPNNFITSPKYPSAYPPNTVCEWRLMSAEYGKGIQLNITDIDLEAHSTCRWDKLQIHNGPDETSPSLSTVCHSQNGSQILTSSGPYMFIKFASDQSKSGQGFKAYYSVVNSECGGEFSAPSGFIQSKNYPLTYDKESRCSWLITVAEQHVVMLNVSNLDIDLSADCGEEYLALYDGNRTGVELFKSCGLVRNQTVRSTSNQMFMEFRSNAIEDKSKQGFRVNYWTGCGAVLAATGKQTDFVSPNFPSRYGKNLNCSYIIKSSTPGTRVMLQFTFLDIEERVLCTSDYLEIRNGDNMAAPVLQKICGRKTPAAFFSSGDSLHVRFVTDDWKEEAGWRAVYSSSLTTCGGEMAALEGTFSSPNHPDNYPATVECVWTIKASPGNTVDLTFSAFNLGDQDDDQYCNHDYVEIREKSSSGPVLGRFCGDTVPTNQTSGVEALWIMFRSSGQETHPGFLAEYRLRHGGEIIGLSAGQIASPLYPMNYPHNSTFSWRITTSVGTVIRVMFLKIDMEDRRCYFDYLALYNGPSSMSPLLGKYCGFEPPQPLVSTSNQLYIVMVSDRYGGNGQGFLLEWEAVNSLGNNDPLYFGPGNTYMLELTATRTPKTLIAPGYPVGLLPNQTYDWRFKTSENDHIEFNIVDMDLGGSNVSWCDSRPRLQFSEGAANYGRRYMNMCGKLAPSPLRSSTNGAKLVLETGPLSSAKGFNLTYQSACGSSIFSNVGQIQSDGYPNAGLENETISCMWNVTTDFGQTFNITFDDLDVAHTSSCRSHYVQIRSNFESTSPMLGGGSLCGSTPPPTIQTFSNRFQVRYYRESGMPSSLKGFSLKYRVNRMACGGELKLTDFVRTGTFTTPNYPENYPTNTECEWTIIAPGGDRVRLDFVDKFEMERPNNNACPWDYVEVRDGGTQEAPLLGKFCGTAHQGTIRSQSNVMYIKFRSDRGLVHTGFRANYSIATCGGMIVDQSGTITSPNYPQSYALSSSYNCEWHVKVPDGHFINFELKDFALPGATYSSSMCAGRDFVEIREYNKTGILNGKLLKRLCGSPQSQIISTSDSQAWVVFNTTASTPPVGLEVNYKFRIGFMANSEVCGGTLTTPSGVFTSPGFPNAYPSNRVCTWKIIAQPGRRVQLEILDFDVEGYGFCQSDYVEIFNGIKADSPRIERMCGSKWTVTNKIGSSMNQMMIKFITDGSRSNKGFRMRYTTLEPATCGGTLNSLNGVITSPGFDLSNSSAVYNMNEDCVWTIRNPLETDQSSVTLQFTHLETEATAPILTTDPCRNDFVEIRAGSEEEPVIQTFCGKKEDLKQDTLVTPGAVITVRFRTDYSHQMKGFRLIYNISGCGGVIYGLTYGFIRSPNYITSGTPSYPSNYSGSVSCAWLVNSPQGSQIELRFLYVEFEDSTNCSQTSLEVLNGRFYTSPRIGDPICRKPAVSALRSQGPSLFLLYRSSGVPTARGFNVQYKAVPRGCGGTFHGNTGYISTPGYEADPSADYPLNTICIWHIIVEPGYHINLTFVGRFDLETSFSCLKDYVQILDPNRNDTELLSASCGITTPNATFSSSNEIKVKFRSDDYITAKGFSAEWSIGCGGRFTDPQGVILSPGFPGKPNNNLDCRYEIIAPLDRPYIRLEFDRNHFDIEGSRRLLVKESNRIVGGMFQAEILCHDWLIVYGEKADNESDAISPGPRVCGGGGLYGAGGDPPAPVRSTNKMIIDFHTDFALAGNGFRLTYSTHDEAACSINSKYKGATSEWSRNYSPF